MSKQTHNTISITDVLGNKFSKENALSLLRQDYFVWQQFLKFSPKHQEHILSFIMGEQGLKITYDKFFMHIMNPDNTPERLEDFLSSLLGEPVKIAEVLHREGQSLAEHGSYITMDVVVRLANGSYVNVEMQKVGFLFSGERSSCYLSDFIMRQYNMTKSISGKNFSYRDLKPVFLIVLMEKSSSCFSAVSPHYIHRRIISYDSGAKVTSLEKIIYISLDTFHSVVHNISTELDAWLLFFSSSRPADIIKIIQAYPKFMEYYKDIALFRTNPKELIQMYSEALAIMDRNTQILMEEERIKTLETDLAETQSNLAHEKAVNAAQKAELDKLLAEIAVLKRNKNN